MADEIEEGSQRASGGNAYSAPPVTYYNKGAGGGFNQGKADSALMWSLALTGTASVVGGILAASTASARADVYGYREDSVAVFSVVALSGLLGGASASSLYSLQAGLDASSKPLGVMMVILGALAPLVVGLTY